MSSSPSDPNAPKTDLLDELEAIKGSLDSDLSGIPLLDDTFNDQNEAPATFGSNDNLLNIGSIFDEDKPASKTAAATDLSPENGLFGSLDDPLDDDGELEIPDFNLSDATEDAPFSPEVASKPEPVIKSKTSFLDSVFSDMGANQPTQKPEPRAEKQLTLSDIMGEEEELDLDDDDLLFSDNTDCGFESIFDKKTKPASRKKTSTVSDNVKPASLKIDERHSEEADMDLDVGGKKKLTLTAKERDFLIQEVVDDMIPQLEDALRKKLMHYSGDQLQNLLND